MPDGEAVVSWLAAAYAAAAIGVAVALLLRPWLRRGRRVPSAAESAWCALLPVLTVAAGLAAAGFHPAPAGLLAEGHQVWHRWEGALHASPLGHGALHAANLALLGLTLICLLKAIFEVSRILALTRALGAASRPLEGQGRAPRIYLLPSSRPLCFTAGVLHPRVYVTASLLEQLSSREAEAMLAHELAHVRRRDRLTATFLSLFSTLLPIPGVRALGRDWQQAAERACDAEAAARIGSRQDVAAALVRVVRLGAQPRQPVSGASAFADAWDDVEGRVQALLAPPEVPTGPLPGRLVLVSLVLVLAPCLWLYHVVELFARH
jgi:beta-lactamase regulating signal transducer with metallopeptidase domain